MSTTVQAAITKYLPSGNPAHGTRSEYQTTLRKWKQWGHGGSIEQLQRKEIRDFQDWVYERAVAQEGTNPGRTANKAREHLPPLFPGLGNKISSRLQLDFQSHRHNEMSQGAIISRKLS